MSRLASTRTAITARRLPGVSLLIALASVVICFLEPLARNLQYDPAAIASGELWRIVTCHLTHWSLDHLFWDVLVFVVAGAICEQENRSRFLACLGISAVAIPLAVWIVQPDLVFYRGLSGIDSALFILMAVTALGDAIRKRDLGWAIAVGLLSIGFIGKTIYEFTTGDTLFVDSQTAGMTPVVLAHVVGAVIGVATATICRTAVRPRPARPCEIQPV
ncbi:MAG: rhombosortase [Planctomycetaceae bacterium]